jgi:predicted ABC-class ATPase
VFAPHASEAARQVEVAEDYTVLRGLLAERGLVAFIADGAVLPRDPETDRPALAHLITFQAPPELRVTLETPHRGPVTGLGIPRGVTVILGPAFSGRSTLLRAIASAVYSHVQGDGREYCATVPDAVWVLADGGWKGSVLPPSSPAFPAAKIRRTTTAPRPLR